MDIEKQKILREYSWNYFSQHAEQRLKTFNFYIVFCAVVIGGYVTIVSRGILSIEHIVLPLLLTFFSFVFWKLDQRTRMLITNGQDAVKYLDSILLADEPNDSQVLALFECDEKKCQDLSKYPLTSGHFSYQRVFNWVFGAMFFVGVAGCIACVLA